MQGSARLFTPTHSSAHNRSIRCGDDETNKSSPLKTDPSGGEPPHDPVSQDTGLCTSASRLFASLRTMTAAYERETENICRIKWRPDVNGSELLRRCSTNCSQAQAACGDMSRSCRKEVLTQLTAISIRRTRLASFESEAMRHIASSGPTSLTRSMVVHAKGTLMPDLSWSRHTDRMKTVS